MKRIALTEPQVIAAADEIARDALFFLAARRRGVPEEQAAEFSDEAIGPEEMEAALRAAIHEATLEKGAPDDGK